MKSLIFGEILYDVYGTDFIIGGASLNYSIHLSRLLNGDGEVFSVSSVGDDDLGRGVLDFLKTEKVNTSLVQVEKNCYTGIATVFLDKNKIPDYIIRENVAWDNILYTEELNNALKESYDIFYINILSQRSHVSADTAKKIFEKIKSPIRVFDVTVRKYFYTKETLSRTLDFVNVLKLNEDELKVLSEVFYKNESIESEKDKEKILEKIKRDFSLDYIFLTLGSFGSAVLSNEGYNFQKANKVNVVDTVGAGDCFSASISYALYKKLDSLNTLRFASLMAEEVVKLKGATAKYDFHSIKKMFFDK